ncbi:hypothetical protein M514_28293 [Trichuris suis]|uniref:Uncharacterized protein n=1 Tax=Trichuris suis TaxID=68888 RepID=A0A085MQN3_9BILA|nr:hypothetical protein M514_28293 [Trichuris suis]
MLQSPSIVCSPSVLFSGSSSSNCFWGKFASGQVRQVKLRFRSNSLEVKSAKSSWSAQVESQPVSCPMPQSPSILCSPSVLFFHFCPCLVTF